MTPDFNLDLKDVTASSAAFAAIVADFESADFYKRAGIADRKSMLKTARFVFEAAVIFGEIVPNQARSILSGALCAMVHEFHSEGSKAFLVEMMGAPFEQRAGNCRYVTLAALADASVAKLLVDDLSHWRAASAAKDEALSIDASTVQGPPARKPLAL